MRTPIRTGSVPPLYFYLNRRPKPKPTPPPIIHPLGLFGATFVREPEPWPNARPEWTWPYADVLREMLEDGDD